MDLIPDYYFPHVADIPVRFLQENGIKGLVLDIDNTLAHDNSCALPNGVREWLAKLDEAGLPCVIVSNNKEQRAADFAALCELPYVAQAFKPSQNTIPKVMGILGVTPEETAVVGDQIFTDISYGKQAGFTTILVDPMGGDDLIFVKFKRLLERPIIRKVQKRGHTKT